MPEKELVLMVGLPRSGKTTWASRLDDPIVNPDSIRLALHGQRFLAPAEPMVWAIAKYMVAALFLAGHDRVIVDATNTTVKRREFWKDTRWVRNFVELHTSKEECLARAALVSDDEIVPVIEKMADQFEPVTRDELGDWELGGA